MEEPSDIGIDRDQIQIHTWRTEQLQTLGLPTALAFAAASWVDWHEVARLAGQGCPPELALEIAR